MNRFLKIFETALKNKTVTGEDVNEVLSKLKDEAMAPGSLTSGDSTLVPLKDEEEISEDSTTSAVAGFNCPKTFQPQTDGQKSVIARMIADALEKYCAFGNDEMTFDNLEEFRTTFAEKTRLKNYPRRKERFGRDPLGANSRKPDSLDEEAESEPAPIDPVELTAAIEMVKASRKLPKDENGALAAPHTIGRIAIGKIVQE